MVDKSELGRVPAFADLPDDQIAWFLGNSQETHVAAGETYVRAGDPADWMFVILEGQFQWRGEFAGETIIFSAKAGRNGRAALFPDEGVHCNRSSCHRRPSSEIPGLAIPRTRAEDARVDHPPGRSDVRPYP